MLDLLLDETSKRWSSWFPGEDPAEIAPMLLAGGPAHRDRVSVMYFADGARSPSVIMKVGLSKLEGGFLASEYEAMDRLRPLLPEDLQNRMPRALDLIRFGQTTVLASQAVRGRRLLISRLTGDMSRRARSVMDSFFAGSFQFTRGVAAATKAADPVGTDPLVAITDDFARRFGDLRPGLGDEAEALGSKIAAEGITWHPSWQHQDVAVGNVLVDRGRLIFVDWEHAGPGCPPWFDVAFTPVVTSHLAQRMDGLGTVKEAVLASLGDQTPLGSILKRKMDEVWDYALPMPWAVTLAAMVGALRRIDEKRTGKREWADLVALLLNDDEVNRQVGWLCP